MPVVGWKAVRTGRSNGGDMIALFDTQVEGTEEGAARVLIEAWTDSHPAFEKVTKVRGVKSYQPGAFYRRELPCMLAVLAKIRQLPSVLVVEGYVWTSPERAPGLGARLHEAIGARAPVVGIAKTPFAGLTGSTVTRVVTRGRSGRPLFVSSLGMNLDEVARHVQAMAGSGRIPVALKWVDRLTRQTAPVYLDP